MEIQSFIIHPSYYVCDSPAEGRARTHACMHARTHIHVQAWSRCLRKDTRPISESTSSASYTDAACTPRRPQPASTGRPPPRRGGGGALSRRVPAPLPTNALENWNIPIIRALCEHVVEADADRCQDYENVLLRP